MTSNKNELPSITAAPDAIELQFAYIHRMANDSLASEQIWSDVNQVAAGEDEASWQKMRQNGFRIGIVASHPPDSLVELLKPAMEQNGNNWPGAQAHIQTVVVRENSSTEVAASPFFESCRIEFPSQEGSTYREYENAQGRYLVTTRKVQDDWVELIFTPAMQHSESRTRPAATADGSFALQHGQKRKVFHSRRFKVRLMVGEWIVIGGNPQKPGTLGHQFYYGTESEDPQLREYHRVIQENGGEEAADLLAPKSNTAVLEDQQFQRLLVVRIANMKQAIVH